MARRRYRSSSIKPFLFKITLLFCVLAGGWLFYRNIFTFNPQRILDTSILKEKTFGAKPIEVISPRHKIKAYLIEDNTNPIISFSLLFKNAGWASDDANKQGLANITAAMLTEGAGNLDSQAFKETLENLAIGINFDASADDFTASMITTSENQQKAYKLFTDIITKPLFASKDMQRIKDQVQKSFIIQKEHPNSVLGLYFSEYLYKNHPYGRNPLGKWENINKLTANDLRNFISTHFAKNNLIIGVAGDISAEKLGTVLDYMFGSLPSNSSINFVRKTNIDFTHSPKNITLPQASGQNISAFASQGVARNHPDFYPLYIANYILGGAGLNSRLSLAIREKEGLTYSIYSFLSLADKSSLIRGGFSCTKENFNKVVSLLQKEWNNFGQNGVTKQEVEDAKKYLLSSYNLRFASIKNLSEILLYMQKDNLGLDFLQKRNENIKQVSIKDINRVAHKYFNTDKMLSVSVGQF